MRIRLSAPKRLLRMLVAAGMASTLGACSDEPVSDAAPVADIVKISALSAQRTEFALYPPSSPEAVVLTAAGAAVDGSKVKVGDRIMLVYVPADKRPYTSGPIEVMNYSVINNDNLRAAEASTIAGWDSEPVYLYSAWLAGPYLNFRLGLTYDPNPRTFYLLVDKEEAASRCPTLYLAHRRKDNSHQPNFMRTYYASFDLSELFRNPDLTGFDVRLNNSNLTTLDTLHFAR